MPHSTPDFRTRAQLTELMDGPVPRDILREYLRGLARTNRLVFGYRPVMRWLESLRPALAQIREPIRILDVGSGYGDGLRRVESWASAHGLAVELTGLDLCTDTTAIAIEATPPGSNIHWINADIFSYQPAWHPHLVMSSLFTHHLSESEIIRFLQWMESHASLGWFINDLSRGALSYHFFRTFSKLVGLHPYVQIDGPISVARSFIAADWQTMCSAAGLNQSAVAIRNVKPGRLCVERRKLA
jgi:hypothetical protein